MVWIEHLLGIRTEAGEGTAWGIEYAWGWAPWLTLLFVVFAVIFVAAVYWRQGTPGFSSYRLMLAAVRLSLVAIVLLMIAQVTFSLKRTGLPYVAVLVDDSLSMTIVNRYAERPRTAMAERVKQAGAGDGQLSRWNLARTLLAEHNAALLRGMAENHQLRVYFLTGVRPSRQKDTTGIVAEVRSLQPAGESTRLGGGVRAVLDELRGTTPAGVVLLTDGINTEGPPLADAAEYARRRGVPLFPIALGSDRPIRDLKLSDLLVDEVAFVDDIVTFECRLTATGFEGQKVPVVLRQQGKTGVLAKTEITVGLDGQPQQVRLSLRPTEVGQFEFVVEAEPPDGQLSSENNRLTRTIQVRKEKLRVLLVNGYPRFEFRYLRNMLQRDETIELHTVLQDADLEHAEQDASALRAFPLRRDELFAYDVVILGDADPALVSPVALQNLADFVDQPSKGGALILIAGPSYMPGAYRDTPLARLLPFGPQTVRYPDPAAVLDQGFVVQPTDVGLAGPALQLGDSPEETQAIWQHLAPLYWLLEMPELKPGARVLAEHSARSGRRRSPLAGHLPSVRRGGQGAFPRHRRDVAMAISGGRRLFRPLLDPDHSLSMPRQTERRRPARGAHDRPPRVFAGRAGAVAGTVCRRATGAGRRRRRDGRGATFRPANATRRAAPRRRGTGHLRGCAESPRAGQLSCLDRHAHPGRSDSGGRFFGGSPGRRVRPGAHRCC